MRRLRRNENVITSTAKKTNLIVFKGLMATGKSTLSRALGTRLGWPVVDKDDFSDVLIGHGVERYGPLSFDAMFSISRSLLRQGFSVVCDSPLRGQIGYLNAKKVAAETDARLRVVVCTCSDETLWRERLETRTHRPAHIIKTWGDFQRYKENALADFDYLMEVPTLEVDTAQPLNSMVEELTVWLQQPHQQSYKEQRREKHDSETQNGHGRRRA